MQVTWVCRWSWKARSRIREESYFVFVGRTIFVCMSCESGLGIGNAWAKSCTFMKKGQVRKEEGFKENSGKILPHSHPRGLCSADERRTARPWGLSPSSGQHQIERNGLKCWEFLKGSASNFGTEEFGFFLLSLKLLVWPWNSKA